MVHFLGSASGSQHYKNQVGKTSNIDEHKQVYPPSKANALSDSVGGISNTATSTLMDNVCGSCFENGKKGIALILTDRQLLICMLIYSCLPFGGRSGPMTPLRATVRAGEHQSNLKYALMQAFPSCGPLRFLPCVSSWRFRTSSRTLSWRTCCRMCCRKLSWAIPIRSSFLSVSLSSARPVSKKRRERERLPKDFHLMNKNSTCCKCPYSSR